MAEPAGLKWCAAQQGCLPSHVRPNPRSNARSGCGARYRFDSKPGLQLARHLRQYCEARRHPTAGAAHRTGQRRPHPHGLCQQRPVRGGDAFFVLLRFHWSSPHDRSAENQTEPPQRAASRRRRRRRPRPGAARRGLRPGLRQAREGRSQDRLHPADRLRQRRHGLGARHRQEVRREDHARARKRAGPACATSWSTASSTSPTCCTA